MRIALVAEDYYPQLGGVPEHVHNLALQLNAWGHTTTVVTSHMGEYRDAPFVRRVGRSRVIYANGGVSRITTGWRLRRRLEQLFRAGRYDLVHVHGGLAPTLGLVAPFAAWRAGIPVVATFHSWFARSLGCRVFRRPFQKILDRPAATAAVSQPVVEANARYFDLEWDIIPNGVDTSFFRPNHRRPAASVTDDPRLLFLGRIEPRNGLGTLLAAMPRGLPRSGSEGGGRRSVAALLRAARPGGGPERERAVRGAGVRGSPRLLRLGRPVPVSHHHRVVRGDAARGDGVRHADGRVGQPRLPLGDRRRRRSGRHPQGRSRRVGGDDHRAAARSRAARGDGTRRRRKGPALCVATDRASGARGVRARAGPDGQTGADSQPQVPDAGLDDALI